MACACVAGGALASIVLPAVRAITHSSVEIYLCARIAWLRFRGFGEHLQGMRFPIDAVSGDDAAGGSGELCDDVCLGCRSEKFHFNRARSFPRYQDLLVREMVLLKFEAMEPLAGWFADRLADVVRENGKGLEADVIVPVPLHKIRRRERGFNQAKRLSKRLAKRLKLPQQGVPLVRKRPCPDKHLGDIQ